MTHSVTLMLFAAVALASPSKAEDSKEPKIWIKAPGRTRVFTRAELLARKDRVQIQVGQDPTTQKSSKPATYEAIPLQALFEGVKIPEGSSVQYHCLDGFSAPISAERLFNPALNAAHAYLAIERAQDHWPVIKPGTKHPTAGPFYLIWTQPQASRIGPEEWPYQLDGFEIKPGLRASFPKLFPSEKLAETDPIHHGLEVFVKNCFSCHTFNQEGPAQMGPDLNFPMNPTEYLTAEALRRQIRDPQNVRYWPQAKMKGFAADALPDSDLEDLLAYLKYMAKHR